MPEVKAREDDTDQLDDNTLQKPHLHKTMHVIILESADPAALEGFLDDAKHSLRPGINVLEYSVDDEKLRMILASLREAVTSTH